MKNSCLVPPALQDLAPNSKFPLPFVQSVADATYFLPAYDLRQATLALASLREQQEAAAAALQPRRRFAFNRKASGKAGGEEAAAAAGEPAQAQAQQQQSQQQAVQEPQPQAAQQPQAPDHSQAAAAAAAGSSGNGSTLSGLRGEIVAPSRDEAEGREFTLSDLEDCTVFLPAPLAALFLHRLQRCRVYTGPVAGACFVEGGCQAAGVDALGLLHAWVGWQRVEHELARVVGRQSACSAAGLVKQPTLHAMRSPQQSVGPLSPCLQAPTTACS